MKVNRLMLIFTLLVIYSNAWSQVDFIGSEPKFPNHPRILLLKGEEESIKRTVSADKIWSKMQQAILAESDSLISLPPVERIQIGRRLLDKSREALRRLFFLSYAYRTTKEQKYSLRAEKELLAISSFSDWNPSHFLDVAEMTMAGAIETIALPMKDYSPDGAYPEGYGYWGYGTGFNVMFISAIEKLFGKDFGLSEMPGFLKTAGYLENMTGPSGNPFNYSDAGSRGGLHPAMFWFATKLKDPSLLWVERNNLLNNGPGTHVKDRLLPAIMLWS